MVSVWEGSVTSNCEICSRKIDEEFIDGRTIMGSWAIMCSPCHAIHGVGYGVGRGQKYSLKNNKFIKVEG